MKTRCPDCSTSFDVTPVQLNARNGKVRCGVCSAVFNAYDHAIEDESDFPVLQADAFDADDGDAGVRPEPGARYDAQHTSGAPADFHSVVRRRSSDRMAVAGNPHDTVEPEQDDMRTVSRQDRVSGDGRRVSERAAGERFVQEAPSLSGSGAYYHEGRNPASDVQVKGQYRRRVQRDTEYDDPEHSNGSGLVWFLAVIFALIVLFAQGAIVFRNQITNVAPTLRPKLVQLCSFVGCQVGYTRSVRNLAILNPALRQVNSPSAAPATRSFRLHAVIRNNDTIAQPWPSIVLSLKDDSESVSARRIIKPEEYLLPDAQKRAFLPNDEVAIDLPIVASRTEVAGFELSLFYP